MSGETDPAGLLDPLSLQRSLFDHRHATSYPVGAEKPVRAAHATSRYSWTRPPSLSRRRNWTGSGSPMRSGFFSAASRPAVQGSEKDDVRC